MSILQPLTPDDRARLQHIAWRYPGLAAAVQTQVGQLLDIVLPAADPAIATERQLDGLIESVVERVVAAPART